MTDGNCEARHFRQKSYVWNRCWEGPKRHQALNGPLPHVPLVPTAGRDVNWNTAADYISAGSAALAWAAKLILKHGFRAGKQS